jgi:hypothetical protein
MKAIFLSLACFTLGTAALAQPAPQPGGPHHPPPPDNGAHIGLQQGEASVDVKCPDETPLKECADTALRLLDRVSGQKPHSRTDSP